MDTSKNYLLLTQGFCALVQRVDRLSNSPNPREAVHTNQTRPITRAQVSLGTAQTAGQNGEDPAGLQYQGPDLAPEVWMQQVALQQVNKSILQYILQCG